MTNTYKESYILFVGHNDKSCPNLVKLYYDLTRIKISYTNPIYTVNQSLVTQSFYHTSVINLYYIRIH